MFEALESAPRLLMEVNLWPVQGDRFQPTGFADLGAAVYQRPKDGARMLLVESAQSMANRLERTCLDGDGPRIAGCLDGLPYVLVKLDGVTDAVTSSLVEAHRINSPYIIKSDRFLPLFREKAGYGKRALLDWKRIGGALFCYDPNSLLHGIFLASEDSRVKIPRAITGFIEAEGVMEAASGGVKNDLIDPTGNTVAINTTKKEVYGNIPFHRTEYVARSITAYFNIDLALLRGYDLGDDAFKLLVALCLFKVQRWLGSDLRLRTACALRQDSPIRVTEPQGLELPPESEILQFVQKGIAECGSRGLFAEPPVTEVTTVVENKKKEPTAGGAGEPEAEAEESEQQE